MRIFDASKEKELVGFSFDPALGRLTESRRFVAHHAAVEASAGTAHEETVIEYKDGNGRVYGAEVKTVWDTPPVKAREAYDEYEDILVYIPFTDEQIREQKREGLRKRRERICFSVINRGRLWYDSLTEEQTAELAIWYRDWLDATDTLVEPSAPAWIDERLRSREREALGA